MTTISGYSDYGRLTATGGAIERSRARTVTLWILQVGAAAMFLAAGVPKLLGAPAMVQMFNTIGIGQWFRYLTGSIEVLSGLSLLVPSLAFYGAAVLVATMVGAIATHLFIVGGSPVPAIVLLAVTSVIAFLRRPW